MKITVLHRSLALILLVFALSTTTSRAADFDAGRYGAIGDGKTVDTAALQATIDACAQAGGGRVVLRAGTYLSAGLVLKSGVTLRLERGALLLAQTGVFKDPFVKADNAHDIAIEGEGALDTQSPFYVVQEKPVDAADWKHVAHHSHAYKANTPRPSNILRFTGCEKVRISGVTLQNATGWTARLDRCSDVHVNGVKIRNQLIAPWTDGIDPVNCSNVLIENCDIVTGDDAICIKSETPLPSRNIMVRNCRVSTTCNGLKIGTGTIGPIENVTFENCEVYGTSNQLPYRPISGIAIESVDGSQVKNVRVVGLRVHNAKNAIFVRLGHRGKHGDVVQADPKIPGSIRDVTIENLRADGIFMECPISGIIGYSIENLTLKNIDIAFEGGGIYDMSQVNVPENKPGYPEMVMFGRLPASAFFIRHVKNMIMERVHVQFAARDRRPPLFAQDVEGLHWQGFQADRVFGGDPLLWLEEVHKAPPLFSARLQVAAGTTPKDGAPPTRLTFYDGDMLLNEGTAPLSLQLPGEKATHLHLASNAATSETPFTFSLP